MKIHDWNPDEGDALQGDVCLFKIPDTIKIDTSDEITAKNGRLILAEGEVTGHHHAVWDRNPPATFRDDGAGAGAVLSPEDVFNTASPQLRAAFLKHRTAIEDPNIDYHNQPKAGPAVSRLYEAMAKAEARIESVKSARIDTGTARLYRDPKAITALVRAGALTTEALAIGILVVEKNPVVLRHDEHDAIRIPPGRYYVGGQQEWDADQARRVAD